jgi:hypothetical protein
LSLPPAIEMKWKEDNSTLRLSSIAEFWAAINRELFAKLRLSSKLAAGVGVFGLLGIGSLMLKLEQYALAVGVWLIIGYILLAKAFYWGGTSSRGLTVFMRTAWVLASLSGCVFLIAATDLNRGDKSWFGLHEKPESTVPAATVAPEPGSLYLDCQMTGLSTTIPASTTIHVMPLQPDLIDATQRIQRTSIFYDVSTNDKPLKWPTKGDGRWLTHSEFMGGAKRFVRQPPMPFMYKCDLSSLGKLIIDDIAIPITLAPNKRGAATREYSIRFDPLKPETHFQFFIVNRCDNQEVILRWPEIVNAHVLGEGDARTLSLNIANRGDSPDTLFFGRSAFKWHMLRPCDWHWVGEDRNRPISKGTSRTSALHSATVSTDGVLVAVQGLLDHSTAQSALPLMTASSF